MSRTSAGTSSHSDPTTLWYGGDLSPEKVQMEEEMWVEKVQQYAQTNYTNIRLLVLPILAKQKEQNAGSFGALIVVLGQELQCWKRLKDGGNDESWLELKAHDNAILRVVTKNGLPPGK